MAVTIETTTARSLRSTHALAAAIVVPTLAARLPE